MALNNKHVLQDPFSKSCQTQAREGQSWLVTEGHSNSSLPQYVTAICNSGLPASCFHESQSHSALSWWEVQIPGLCFYSVWLLFTEQSFQILKPGDWSICYSKSGPGVAGKTESDGSAPIHTHLAAASKSTPIIFWHLEAVAFIWGLSETRNWE